MIHYNGKDFANREKLVNYLYTIPMEYKDFEVRVLDEVMLIDHHEVKLADLRVKLINRIVIKVCGFEYKIAGKTYLGTKNELKKLVLLEIDLAEYEVKDGKLFLLEQPLIGTGSLRFVTDQLKIRIGEEIDNL